MVSRRLIYYANVIPDAGILFEIHAPLYGVVGTFIVEPSTDSRNITDGGLDVRFYCADKWYLRLMRLVWPFRGKDFEGEENQPKIRRARQTP